MSEDAKSSASGYERGLLRDIERIEAQLQTLTRDRDALRRRLTQARRESHHLKDVSRKNSIDRALVEQKVLLALEEASKPLTNAQLFQVARWVNYELKDATFRTYLHRMKKKGLIENVERGRWRTGGSKR